MKAAPFWRRVLADLIDLSLLGGLAYILWTSGVIAPERLPEKNFDWIDYAADLIADHLRLFQPAAIAIGGAGALYGIVTRLLMAGTVGERLVGLRLIGPDGRGAGPLRALAHAAGTVLGLAALSLGYLWAAVDLRRQGLAEYVSGTMLVAGAPIAEGGEAVDSKGRRAAR